jgi:uncharacterized surface protein with fasciclin (FAS1) repeats
MEEKYTAGLACLSSPDVREFRLEPRPGGVSTKNDDLIRLDTNTYIFETTFETAVVNFVHVTNGPQKFMEKRMRRSNRNPNPRNFSLAIAAVVISAFTATVAVAGGHKSDSQQGDIVDVAVSAGQFTTLAAALDAADLISTL